MERREINIGRKNIYCVVVEYPFRDQEVVGIHKSKMVLTATLCDAPH